MQWSMNGKQDVYLEVAEHFKNRIRAGKYRSGAPLPSVRAAAAELEVNPNTVQKAYALLERDGMIAVVPKKGAFVISTPAKTEEPDRRAVIEALRKEGVSLKTLYRWIKEVYES